MPDVEEFTIGRRLEKAGEQIAPGPEWDEASLRRLATQANGPTLALLDLCAAEEAGTVTIKDVAQQASCSEGSVRAGLAGLTMRLKNLRYGFEQTSWPMDVSWLPGGLAAYHLEPRLAEIWRSIRSAASIGE